ncbi:Fe-S cluster assembly ATPase SufC [Candidatus Bandiella euplotis]|uniref:ATP-dependent transporter SufC n=1 Tax=Candidatus Bandiella euplotis TaxID=1664265 RepID=A0ABZ0UJY6_9RICK|nr:Fe-S cluster assembly ATPase SufC [Candidatus Bandiella woodruffii]WPX96267.1 putative ATP-dependent transporter SufC [Candidatus Bandiella woodruffii]
MLLEILKLKVNAGDKEIIKSLDLKVKAGETHVIMGPNGTGKSTVANIIAGKAGYQITDGKIEYKGQDIRDVSIDARARLGIFMSFQYPIEIPGVNWISFLKASVNAIRKHNGMPEADALEFLKTLREKANLLGIDENFFKRSVNHGFSGGEKKKFEILQMLLLEPKLAILDEIDSGLDVDALKMVAQNINNYRIRDNSIIIITHYQRLLDYIVPDHVHIFYDGKIVRSGNKDLAKQVELQGYDKLVN